MADFAGILNRLYSPENHWEFQTSLERTHGPSATGVGDDPKLSADSKYSRHRDLVNPKELELAEFTEIIDCNQAGVCKLESVPGSGLDRLAKRFDAKGKNVFGLCCTNQAVADLHAVGIQAALVDQLILEVAGKPFELTQSRKKKLRSRADILVRQAARKLGIDLSQLSQTPDEIGLDLLKPNPKLSLPEELVHGFWCRASTVDNGIVRDWTKELAEDPAPMIRHLDDLGVDVIIAVNWPLLEEWYRRLLASIARYEFRVLVVADPRADNIDPWRSLDNIDSHTHRLSVSVNRSAQVLSALSKTEAGSGSHILTLSPIEEPESACATEVYESRESAIAALGSGLSNLPGLSSKKSNLEPQCDLGIGDVRGKTILVVVHTKTEAIEIKSALRNYIAEPVEILGNSDLWRAKLTRLCQLLDPTGFVCGDGTDAGKAASSCLSSICKAMSSRFFPNNEAPAEFTAAASVGLTSVDDSDNNGEALDIYVELAKQTMAQLAKVERRGDPEVALAARETVSILSRHVFLLEKDSDDSTREIIKLAHELFDMRALGFEQSNSGLQRWYVWPATFKARGGNPLDVATQLERHRENPWGWSPKLTAPDADKGAVFVTHIQRLGNDVADHVILCRTSKKHMPYVGGYGTRVDPGYEAALFYRAVASARDSVHMLSVDDSPYYIEPMVDHRRR